MWDRSFVVMGAARLVVLTTASGFTSLGREVSDVVM